MLRTGPAIVARTLLGAAVLAGFGGPGVATPPARAAGELTTGDEVLAAARAVQAPVVDRTSTVEMKIRAPSGEERVRTLRGYEKRTPEGRRLLWLFESPTELAGTGFLAWQQRPAPDQMWIYFPGQRRVRRISPELRREQFQGSTFTYEDLTTVFHLDYEGAHTLHGVDACGTRRCYVVDTALPAGQFVYERLRTWIRTEDLLPEKIELEGGGATKRMRVVRTDVVEGVPTILEAEMETPADGYRTTVTYRGVDYNSGLGDELFTVGHLERRGK
jgi:hypothetical protein